MGYPADAVIMPSRLSSEDEKDLLFAISCLEGNGLSRRIVETFGRAMGMLTEGVPEPAQRMISAASEKALLAALKAALRSLDPSAKSEPALPGHRVAMGLTGAIGGAFGLMALPIELPLSTTILLRSVADIARSEGEDLSQPESMLACIEVFALDAGEGPLPASASSYLAARAALATPLRDGALLLAKQGIQHKMGAQLTEFVTQTAARFSAVVGKKVIAQSAPMLGAVGGATINMIFISHFQKLAQGHFIVRRLERKHDREQIAFEYRRLRGGIPKDIVA